MVSFNSLTQSELQQILFQLEQALYNHQQWHNALIRTLVCRLSGYGDDLLPDAHKQCRFGQWYYWLYPKKNSESSRNNKYWYVTPSNA